MARTSSVSIERRQELVATANVTLNGRPAGIAGSALDFARVSDRETGLSAEWAWETVDLIVTERGGAFMA